MPLVDEIVTLSKTERMKKALIWLVENSILLALGLLVAVATASYFFVGMITTYRTFILTGSVPSVSMRVTVMFLIVFAAIASTYLRFKWLTLYGLLEIVFGLVRRGALSAPHTQTIW